MFLVEVGHLAQVVAVVALLEDIETQRALPDVVEHIGHAGLVAVVGVERGRRVAAAALVAPLEFGLRPSGNATGQIHRLAQIEAGLDLRVGGGGGGGALLSAKCGATSAAGHEDWLIFGRRNGRVVDVELELVQGRARESVVELDSVEAAVVDFERLLEGQRAGHRPPRPVLAPVVRLRVRGYLVARRHLQGGQLHLAAILRRPVEPADLGHWLARGSDRDRVGSLALRSRVHASERVVGNHLGRLVDDELAVGLAGSAELVAGLATVARLVVGLGRVDRVHGRVVRLLAEQHFVAPKVFVELVGRLRVTGRLCPADELRLAAQLRFAARAELERGHARLVADQQHGASRTLALQLHRLRAARRGVEPVEGGAGVVAAVLGGQRAELQQGVVGRADSLEVGIVRLGPDVLEGGRRGVHRAPEAEALALIENRQRLLRRRRRRRRRTHQLLVGPDADARPVEDLELELRLGGGRVAARVRLRRAAQVENRQEARRGRGRGRGRLRGGRVVASAGNIGAGRRDSIVGLAGVLAGVLNASLHNGVIELVADRLARLVLEPFDSLDGRICVNMTGECDRRTLQHPQGIEQAEADARRVCASDRIGSGRVRCGVESRSPSGAE